MFFLFNVLAFLTSLLGYKGIDILAKAVGFLAFDVLRIRRSIILQNLDLVFAENKTRHEKNRIARASFASFVATLLEFIAAKRLFPKAKVQFIHKQIVHELLAKNQGLYALCIHMGNWELLCSVNAKAFAPVHVVVKAIGKGKLAQWVEGVRTHIGFSLIDRAAQSSATAQIFKALQKKEIVGFIVDQKRPRGEHLPFFGKNASTNTSLAKLYSRKKAPILPAIIKRKAPGEFDILFFPEFIMEDDPSLSRAELVSLNSIKMNKQVEEMILANPQEYFWMHNRWDFKK